MGEQCRAPRADQVDQKAAVSSWYTTAAIRVVKL